MTDHTETGKMAANNDTVRWATGVVVALAVWVVLYSQLIPFSEWVVLSLGVERKSHLGEAVAFFMYDTPKVLLLLTLVVFVTSPH